MKIGDKLYRSKGAVQHVGVYLGGGNVVHTSPGKGVEVATLGRFAAGKKLRIVPTAGFNEIDFHQRLQEMLAKRNTYSVLAQNCEHLANYLLSGNRTSPQLQGAIAGLALSAVLNEKVSFTKLTVGIAIGLMVVNLATQQGSKSMVS